MRKKLILIDDNDEGAELSQILGLGFTNVMLFKDFITTKDEYQDQLNSVLEEVAIDKAAYDSYVKSSTEKILELDKESSELIESLEGKYGEEWEKIQEEIVDKRTQIADLKNGTPELDMQDKLVLDLQSKVDNFNDLDHSLQPECDYMLIGKECFHNVRDNYHLGLRKINYPDTCSLPIITIEGDIRLTFFWEVPGADKLSWFNSESFKPGLYPLERSEILKTFDASKQWLDYFSQVADGGVDLGFDYETNGIFPLQPGFFICGFSLSTDTVAAYFSWVDMYQEGTLDQFLPLFKEFCGKHEDLMWAFYMAFEEKCTYSYFQTNYFFQDAQVVNLLEERNWMPKSLKYTATLLFQVPSWDNEFDWLTEVLEDMFAHHPVNTGSWLIPDDIEFQDENDSNKYEMMQITDTGDFLSRQIKDKNEGDIVATAHYNKVTGEAYTAGLMSFDVKVAPSHSKMVFDRFPDLAWSFKELIVRNYGLHYACIPAEILGSYCNKDSQYTKLIADHTRANFTDECIRLFMYNIQLGARLSEVGIVKDEKIHKEYSEISTQALCFSIYYVSVYDFKSKLEELTGAVNNLEDYPVILQTLIHENLYNENYSHMAKHIIRTYQDDEFQYGVDSNKIIELFGADCWAVMEDYIDDAVGKVDSTIWRSRKLFNWMGEWFEEHAGVPEHLKANHDNTITALYYKRCVDDLAEASWQFEDGINGVPKEIKIDGYELDHKEFIDHCKEEYTGITSHDQYNGIMNKSNDKFLLLDVYLGVMYVDSTDEFYDWFMEDIPEEERTLINLLNIFKKKIPTFKEHGWVKEYDTTIEMLNEWDPSTFHEEYYAFATHFRMIRHFCPKDWESFQKYFRSNQMDTTSINGYLKLVMCMRIWKKYSKMETTYINGLFVRDDAVVSQPDHNLISWENPEPWNNPWEGGVTKMYPRFNVCNTKSKRWSSGFHTIYGKADCKRIVSSPENTLLSYFDISQAEVRTIAYRSGDPKMIEWYEQGVDLYIEVGKMINPQHSIEELYELRPDYKVVLLADFYNESARSTASRQNKPIEEIESMKADLGSIFKVAKKWSQDMVDYASTNRTIKTILGDKITLDDEPDYRIKTMGVNLAVQGFTSVVLAAGFNNILRAARDNGIMIQPIIVVHDAGINYFDIKKILEIGDFYYEHFTEWLFKQFGVRYEFGLELGTNYHDLAEFKSLGNSQVQLKGSNLAIKQILDRFETNGISYEVDWENPPVLPVKEPLEEIFVNEAGKAYFLTSSIKNKAIITVTHIE